MRVPLAWLRDYVDLPDADTIVARLASLGFPVDDVETRPALSGVVAGRITAVAPHPNADRLQLCTIDAGGVTLTIATAATNVAQGQIVPVARIGAQLAGGMSIGPRKMRGIDSEGMLCSAEELGLPPHGFEDGIMQFDASVPIGADVVAHFRLSEPVLDVDVTPNRADALAIVGLARELAAAFGTPLREPAVDVAFDDRPNDARVTIETTDCKRFVFAHARDVRVEPAPAWMRIRLALAGQRPINNLVDISNFVMMEVGEPLHFFDFARVRGGHLIVRDARDGERFTTLDGHERTLDARTIVIADDDGPTSVAGVMGGLRSEVEADTTELLIEAAAWNGPRIRRSAAALKLRTEASARFEKSPAPALADLGFARAARLLADAGARIGSVQTAGAPLPVTPPIALRASEVERLLGFAVAPDVIEQSLRALGFAVAREPDALAVTAPYWRGDVTIAADLVEEIARIVGYDGVEARVPAVAPQDLDSAQFDRETELAATMAALGYTEALSLSLQPAATAQQWHEAGIATGDVVEIRNPLSEDQRFMRFSLFPALFGFAARDRAVRPYRIFELGHVFADAAPLPHESVQLAAVHAGGESAFGRLKSDLLLLIRRTTGREARVERGTLPGLHPGKCAALLCDGDALAYVGVIDPRLARANGLEPTTAAALLLVDALPAHVVARYVAPSRFPALERDLAIVVAEDVLAGDVIDAVRREPLVAAATVFDVYRGPQVGAAKKSLALRIALQSATATLTEVDADAAVARIVATLHDAFAATLRT
jgi:phenylalanyl-tRNA synthetase beta chain